MVSFLFSFTYVCRLYKLLNFVLAFSKHPCIIETVRLARGMSMVVPYSMLSLLHEAYKHAGFCCFLRPITLSSLQVCLTLNGSFFT